MFFVISGYLITSILIAQHAQGGVSLARFYERRARRILPALLLVLLVCVPLAWLWMTPEDLFTFSRHVVAVSLFSSNIFSWTESGYFDESADITPLLHTWSLSVEEQYYVLFPIAFVAAARFGRLRLALILAMCVSFAVALWGSQHKPAAAFYLLPTRAWELLMGALVADFLSSHQAQWSARTDAYVSAAGMALILGAVGFLDSTTPFREVYALLPTIGTVLVLISARGHTPVGRLLGTRALVSVGLISYSAYLWHQPVLAFARIRSLNPLSALTLLALLALVLVLAWATWRFIETPFRGNRIATRRLVQCAAGGTALCLGIGFAGIKYQPPRTLDWLAGGLPRRFEGVRDEADRRCSARDPNDACYFPPRLDGPTVAIVGDSHAVVLSESILEMSRERGYGFLELTASGCPFALDLQVFSNSVPTECGPEYQHKRLAKLAEHKNLIVVMHARWPMYIEGGGFDNGVGGIETRWPFVLAKSVHSTRQQRAVDVEESLLNTAAEVRRQTHQVIIVQAVPATGWDPIQRLLKIERLGIGKTFEDRASLMKVPFANVERWNGAARTALARVQSRMPEDVVLVDPMPFFCNVPEPGSCRSIGRDVLYYSDRDHLSKTGADILATLVFDRVAR